MGMTRFLGTALGAAALLVGAGCSAVDGAAGKGGASPTPTSNGVADKPPVEILRSAQHALRNSDSVHLKGNGTAEGQVYALDVRIEGTRAGRGTFTIMHNPVEILRIGQDVYVKGSADFWRALTGDRTAAELLKGKYLKARRNDPNFTALLGFTDAAAFSERILKADGEVTKADRRTVAGVETIGVTFASSGGDKQTVYVATTGKPYPMYLSTTGKTPDKTGELEFTEYDKPLDIKPPAPDLVVDLNR